MQNKDETWSERAMLRMQAGISNDKKNLLRDMVMNSNLTEKDLAVKLLTWCLEPIQMVPERNNNSSFRKMKGPAKNTATIKAIGLLVVYLYGYGELNCSPRAKHEKSLLSYKDTLRHMVYERGCSMIDFIMAHRTFFKDTAVDANREHFLHGNLYDRLDGMKTLITTKGLFDPISTHCYHAENCGGMYWWHYYKITQVVDCLVDSAKKTDYRFISDEQYQMIENDHGIMYEPERVLLKKAIAFRVECRAAGQKRRNPSLGPVQPPKKQKVAK